MSAGDNSPLSLWLSLELDPGTAAFYGLAPRLYVPLNDSRVLDGQSRLSVKDLAEALETAVSEHPEMGGRADVHRFLARWERFADLERYLGFDNPTFAEAVCRSLLRDDPQNPPALAGLGLLRAREGEWTASLEFYDRALEAAPAHAPTLLEHALASTLR